MEMANPIIALDCDGVLLDYHAGYRQAWAKAFGSVPAVRDPDAYWPIDRWEVTRLSGDKLTLFRSAFDSQFWSSIPANPGAVQACHRLAARFELVCVTALETEFEAARLKNLRSLGFPINRVIATANLANGISPKASALAELRPVAFVDDFAPYLKGIPADIHAALLLREPNGSPNTGELLNLAHSTHTDLTDFADWWLAR